MRYRHTFFHPESASVIDSRNPAAKCTSIKDFHRIACELPEKYKIIYADPPWAYYGSSTKNAAAGKHYKLTSQHELCNLPIRRLADDKAWLFMWATPSRLHLAIQLIECWGFHFRNVAYQWNKTTKTGVPISDRQGVRPTYTKTAWFELLLVASTKPYGRMTPLNSEAHSSRIHAPRGRHSEKPDVFRQMIVEQLGDIPRVELFARDVAAGWDSWGNDPALTVNS